MLNTKKHEDLKRAIENFVGNAQSLVLCLFLDIPELEVFTFVVSSEYDDNNYSDQTRLVSINNRHVDWDLLYHDEDGDVEEDKSNNDLPVIRFMPHREAINNVSQTIGSHYGHDVHEFKRSNFISKSDPFPLLLGSELTEMDPEIRYARSHILNETIEESWFLKVDPKWACYYAQEHGRFDPKIEKKIFCKKNRMMFAFMYAQAIKEPLPDFIENYFTTRNLIDTNKEDNEWFKVYLNFKKSI